MNNSPLRNDLVEIAHRCRAHYEVGAESLILRDDKIHQIGFRLDLYGRDEANPLLFPEDERCREIYRSLHEIASGITPESGDSCRLEIGGFLPALYYLNGKEGEVRLEIRILHDDQVAAPVDGELTRVLRETEERLGALHVHRGRGV